MAASGAAHAGAWPQAKGEGLLITTLLVERAESWFDDGGARRPGGWYRKQESSTYLEYGLTDRITLLGRVAWQDVERIDAAGAPDAARGFAASEAGLRLGLRRWRGGVVSIQASGILPGQAENIADRPLGYGATAVELRGLAGWSWGETAFAEIQTGYRWRRHQDADEIRLDLTIGWRPRDRWLLIAQSQSAWSAYDPVPGRRPYAQHAVQASVGFETSRGDVHVGVRATPAGRNAIDPSGYFVSFWRRF